jgi:hypothetical protein
VLGQNKLNTTPIHADSRNGYLLGANYGSIIVFMAKRSKSLTFWLNRYSRDCRVAGDADTDIVKIVSYLNPLIYGMSGAAYF